MKIRNRHERMIAASPERIAVLIADLAELVASAPVGEVTWGMRQAAYSL